MADGMLISFAEEKVKDFLKQVNDGFEDVQVNILVSQSDLVDAFRLMVLREKIPADLIQFKYKDQFIRCDRNGRLEEWPKGFCDIGTKILTEMLEIGSRRAREAAKKRQERWRT